MTSNLQVIFDGTLNANTIQESQVFTNSNFLLLDVISPTLAANEGILLGLALLMKVPIVQKTAVKYIPHKITDFEVNAREIGDSKELIAIPYEFCNSDYEMFVGLNSSENVTIRVYAVSNYQFDIDDNNLLLQDIKSQLETIQLRQNINIGLNQNLALSIIGTGLIPVNGGVTSPVPIIVGNPVIPLLPAF